MTTIHQLPQELLPQIFKNLAWNEQIPIQQVCRAWYLPAHALLLKGIYLHSESEIEKFIASIDQNTASSYLAAVEKIVLHTDDAYGVDYHLNKENMEKLICRFPNLAYVSIHSYVFCLEEFDEELCQIILNSCPKLKHFGISLESEDDEDEDLYCSTMYKLRSLVTSLNLSHIGSASGFGGIVKFITSFPRLQELYDMYNQSFSFRDYLAVFEQLSNLTSISIDRDYYGEEENFTERYFARKTKEERVLIIERLSKVDDLTYYSSHPFCSNTIKFIAKYLTGLKNVTIDCSYEHGRWTPVHHQLLVDEMTSILAKSQGCIGLRYMKAEPIAEFLPKTIQKLYSRLPPHNRTLQLDVQNYCELQGMIHVRMQWPAVTDTTITLVSQPSMHEVVSTLFKSQISDIDHFVFCIRDRARNSTHINLGTYNIILKAVSSLKKVTFDIPKSYRDVGTAQESQQYSLMEELTLRLTLNVKVQSMLDAYALMLPNLKYLNLYYYSCTWRHHKRELYINLTNYTLDQLVLDMTPLKRMMKKQSIEGDYFVIYVSGKEERYKVSFDFSSVTSISEEDSQGYICVQILITSLNSLKGYMYTADNDDYDEYLHGTNKDNLKMTIIFE